MDTYVYGLFISQQFYLPVSENYSTSVPLLNRCSFVNVAQLQSWTICRPFSVYFRLISSLTANQRLLSQRDAKSSFRSNKLLQLAKNECLKKFSRSREKMKRRTEFSVRLLCFREGHRAGDPIFSSGSVPACKAHPPARGDIPPAPS
jgi:hypothetical protein